MRICGADGTKADTDEGSGLGLGIFLEKNAADDLAIESGELLEAALDIEDEDQCVFKGADGAAGDPAPVYGLSENVGRAPDLRGGIEIAAQQLAGVFAVEGPADDRLCRRLSHRVDLREGLGQLSWDMG